MNLNIADRIQYLRKEKHFSQEELADKLGVSRQSVSKWESEQSNPDLEKIILMSEVFEVTTDYILKGIEPAPDQSKNIKYSLYSAFMTIFFIIGAIWSFSANRFRIIEIIYISVGLAIVGLAVGLIIEVILNVLKK